MRNIAVSNIAWPTDAHDEAYALLSELGITAVEIAPYNVFHGWDISTAKLREFRSRLDDAGLACVALQGIAANVTGAHLFESIESRARLRAHLIGVACMAAELGAGACVFGAPKLRSPGLYSDSEAFDIATGFLRSVGPIFADQGTTLAFEANSTRYGCKFVTTTAEAIILVREVAMPGIRLQIDTGTVFLENEDPNVLAVAVPLAVHAHISEPLLIPVGNLNHRPFARALASYHGSMSVEMKPDDPWQDNLRSAVRYARRTYE